MSPHLINCPVRPLPDHLPAVRTPHPVEERPRRLLKHRVFNLEDFAFEVLVRMVEKTSKCPHPSRDKAFTAPSQVAREANDMGPVTMVGSIASSSCNQSRKRRPTSWLGVSKAAVRAPSSRYASTNCACVRATSARVEASALSARWRRLLSLAS
jgi:hypothetical protein